VIAVPWEFIEQRKGQASNAPLIAAGIASALFYLLIPTCGEADSRQGFPN